MRIRQMHKDEIDIVCQLENSVWGSKGASGHQIAIRAHIFPQGSLVAVLSDGQICGYVVVQRVDQISTSSWAKQTDNGLIKATHQPNGKIIYGVNMSALPEAASLGVSGAIIDYCAQTFLCEGECNSICLGSRVPGFKKWSIKNNLNVTEYLSLRRNGFSVDPELRLYEKNRFRLLWEIDNYFPDEKSCNFGVMIIRNRWD